MFCNYGGICREGEVEISEGWEGSGEGLDLSSEGGSLGWEGVEEVVGVSGERVEEERVWGFWGREGVEEERERGKEVVGWG